MREIALGFLARREHSRLELLLKLKKRGGSDEVIAAVVNVLVEEGMQSNTRFADAFTRSRIDRGAGPVRIRAELAARGVEEELVEKALTQYSDWWKDSALEAYEKRYGSERIPEDYEQKAKRANFLQRRGFTMEHIQYVLKQYDS